MMLGIDVGGTHTDAIIIDGGEITASAKKVTRKQDLVGSIVDAVIGLGIDVARVKRVVLSTTLATNSIVENTLAPVGMVVSAGPGIDPREYFLNEDFYLVKGAIDHRGREYQGLSDREVVDAGRKLKARSIEGIGIVSKFSVRNPMHENRVHYLLANEFKYISMGHQMSGSLNFPRRIYTAYFNTAVMPLQHGFLKSVGDAFRDMGINADILILKADGGTITHDAAFRLPVETILSGPAASIMGAIALTGERRTALVLDIGGTTTDIGVLVKGVPLMQPQGVDMAGKKTLVRGLDLLSLGLAGDSTVVVEDGKIRIGPGRKGPPACLGGTSPTPTDALSVMGLFDKGERRRAEESFESIAQVLDKAVEEVARQVIRNFCQELKSAVTEFIDVLNSRPVYTIHDMIYPELISPETVIVVGGPAGSFCSLMEDTFGLECKVPQYHEVANAIGACLARTTVRITLVADTHLGKLICPELDIEKDIPGDYSPDDVKVFGMERLDELYRYLGMEDRPDIDVVEEQSFNMVRGFRTVGKNIRLRVQSRPGVLSLSRA
ncbi:MAG TPA: hydantoinase/oxoprolinase family protein [Deltaproteobacteria bacterium]|nr:hydantoinase/oxoprolinase family protein [Deltaproteobacteria bacterium]